MTYFDSAIGSGRLALLIGALLIAFGFEFVNGFHDTANAVATVIYTRSLRPWYAVIWSGMCNFTGVYVGGIAVAMSLIKLLPVELLASSGSGAGLAMVLALLVSAITWNLATWYFGLPASSSHTLIGAIVGVGLANSAMPGNVFGSGINWHKVREIGVSLVVSPLFGMAVAGILVFLAARFLRSRVLHDPADATQTPPWWVRFLLIGTCSGVSFAHGSNDGQKGVGLVMLILIGILPADFALNTSYDTRRIDQTVAAVEHMGKTTALAYADSERPVFASNGGGASPESISASVVSDLASIKGALRGKHSLRDVPVEERWDLRTKVQRVEANLASLEKSHPGALSKDRADAMMKDRATLKAVVEYAPSWVLICIALALGIGTMIGWKRIVVTVGEKIGKTHMSYAQGASAELVAASTIAASGYFGLPVSTTHVLSSGVAGTMLARKSGLQSSTVRNIALAWVLTLPVAMLLSAALFVAFRGIIPDAPQRAVAKIDATIHSADPEAAPAMQVVTKNALRLHGSNTMGAALAPELAEAFLAKKQGSRITRNAGKGEVTGWVVSAQTPGGPAVIEVEAAGSGTAFDDLASGACDVGLSSRRATAEEAARVAQAGRGDLLAPAQEHVIGLDGIAVIVHRQNPVASLSLVELGRIYSGETRSWPGAAGNVTLLARDDHSGTTDVFKAMVLGGRPMATAERFVDNARLSERVETDVHAVGFVPMSAVRDAKAVAIGDEGGIPTVPSAFNVGTESYALARRVYLYTAAAPAHPLAREFVDFALSDEGQRVVAAAGFVDLALKTRAPFPCAKECPPRYAALTSGAERLSVDFRFTHGSAALDARGNEDIARVAAFVKTRPDARLGLFGFADDVGRADVNIQVSRERAKAVETELRARGVPVTTVESFGEALPIASNATETGRERNRRVEVWLVKP